MPSRLTFQGQTCFARGFTGREESYLIFLGFQLREETNSCLTGHVLNKGEEVSSLSQMLQTMRRRYQAGIECDAI